MTARGAYGGTSSRGGHHLARTLRDASACAPFAACPACGGALRFEPRRDGAFLVPGPPVPTCVACDGRVVDEAPLSLAQAFVPVCRQYDPLIENLAGLVEATGGAALCWDVSTAFVVFAREQGVGARVVWLLPDASLANHAVALVGAYVVDHTARQFDEQAPFPFVALRAEYMRWFAAMLPGGIP